MTVARRNILLLSAGRRVELSRALAAAIENRDWPGRLICGDVRPELSSACADSGGGLATLHARSDGYGDALLSLCAAHDIAMVIPTIDTELLPLAQIRATAAEQGTTVVISDEALIRNCRDKRLTHDLFVSLGLPTPEIYSPDTIRYPCFTKPAGGSSSIGAFRLDTVDQLTSEMMADSDRMFMELVGEGARELTIDLYYDRDHRLICCVPRERIETRAGEVSKGVTRRDWVYDALVDTLNHVPGARGCLTLQLFADDAKRTIQAIEINPRFGGGYPLAQAAGADFPGWLIAEYLQGSDCIWFDGWEADLLMLRYDAARYVHGY